MISDPLLPIIGRIAAIDYGARRIGVALSDRAQSLASPAAVLNATGRPEDNARIVIRWAEREEPAAWLVGLPLNMDGSEGEAARAVRVFAAALAAASTKPIQLWDERLTSFGADQHIKEMGLSRKKRRERQDALAACVLLQSYLQARVSSKDLPLRGDRASDTSADG